MGELTLVCVGIEFTDLGYEGGEFGFVDGGRGAFLQALFELCLLFPDRLYPVWGSRFGLGCEVWGSRFGV